MVDANNIGRHLGGRGFLAQTVEAERQIAYADRILVNKVDMVTLEQVAAVEDLIRTVNSTAVITRTSHAKANVDDLLNINAFSALRFSQVSSCHLACWRATPPAC